jgi:hypothetical protein
MRGEASRLLKADAIGKLEAIMLVLRETNVKLADHPRESKRA